MSVYAKLIFLFFSQDYSNDRLFTQYGFVLAGNPVNAIAWPALNTDAEADNTESYSSSSTVAASAQVLSGPVAALKERVFDYLIEAATK